MCLAFQYISCYCLSSLLPNIFWIALYFNTSHVTVYPMKYLQIYCYIFHFNTSHVTVYPNLHTPPFFHFAFQYISCYCLSCYSLEHMYLYNKISIHLMLLFIFNANTKVISYLYFNTSHVTVYQVR